MYSSLSKALAVSALSFFLLTPLGVSAATIFLSPSQGTRYSGENFSVDVKVNSDVSLNAFSGIVLFPTDTLEVLRITQPGSIINLWTQNPSFSNSNTIGNVTFEGVVLSPGFIGSEGRILTITFRVKQSGSANLTFSRYTALKNDGLGTDAGATANGAYFTFLSPRAGTQGDDGRGGVAAEKVYIPTGIMSVWNFLPGWIQFSILSLVGLTAILLALIITSFGVIILIWAWSHIRRRENDITRFFTVLRAHAKHFFRAIPSAFGLAGKEVFGDVRYGLGQLLENAREAKRGVSLSRMLSDFGGSLKRIIKRFFTRNINR